VAPVLAITSLAARASLQRPFDMAHRLARLVYRMLKYGQQYVDKGAEYYEPRNRQQQIEFLRKKAAQLGLQVTAAHP